MVNLIINDTPVPDRKVREVFAEFQPSAEILSARELTLDLEKNAATAMLGIAYPKSVALIFPGEGAKSLYSFLSPEVSNPILQASKWSVPAYRVLSGNKPISVNVEIPTNILKGINEERIEQVWVCDDVIATGLTIRSIASVVDSWLNRRGENYNPSLRFSFPTQRETSLIWQAFCWLQREDADIGPFKSQPAAIYKSPNSKRKVPLNSLSTLLSNSNRGSDARTRYSQKNFNDERKFYELLATLSTNT